MKSHEKSHEKSHGNKFLQSAECVLNYKLFYRASPKTIYRVKSRKLLTPVIKCQWLSLFSSNVNKLLK